MQNIETGYRPEFGLGAFFAGQNSANANDINEEELSKLFLANQRDAQMLPYDLQRKQLEVPGLQYEAELNRQKNSNPNYIPSVINGYMGQMDTQVASGRYAMATEPGRTKVTNIQNSAIEREARLLDRLNQLKDGGIPSPVLGNMMVAPNKADGTSTRGDASWQIPKTVQAENDSKAMLLLIQEAEANPNDPALQREIMALRKKMNGDRVRGGDPLPVAATAREAVPVQSQSEYDYLMKALTDTPQQRQAMEKAAQKTDAAIEAAKIRAAGQLEAIRAKVAATPVKGAKTLEEALVAYQTKLANGHTPTPAEIAAHDENVNAYNVKWEAQYKPGITTEVGPTGKIGIINKPAPAKYVPKRPISNETKEINGVTYERVEGGWQRKR